MASVIDGQEATKKEFFQESNLDKLYGFESVEDVAWCLVMLSRDVWTYPDPKMRHTNDYTCEVCKKVFKSPQGLGSHKASHDRKANNSIYEVCEDNIGKQKNVTQEQIYECSIGCKTFRSAQALEGHRKSHFLASKIGECSMSINLFDNFLNFYIDLNTPPPMEDEDEKVDSEQEV